MQTYIPKRPERQIFFFLHNLVSRLAAILNPIVSWCSITIKSILASISSAKFMFSAEIKLKVYVYIRKFKIVTRLFFEYIMD